MRVLITLGFAVFLSACAGAPPAWWNPSGAYGDAELSAPQPAAVRTSLSQQVSAEEEEPLPLEQSIEPAQDSYEELNLNPLSGEETPVAAPADLAEQTPAPAQEENPTAPAETEHLPADGSLPFPTVLE